MHATSAAVLRETFGYDSFRGEQQSIIEHTVAGGDSLVLMPTGGGKSLCYQIPAIVREGTGIVISPLIALMHNQVSVLSQSGVRAVYLNSTLSHAEVLDVEKALRAGRVDLLYVAPERLLGERTLALLDEMQLALFAIDEAHCVSHWGHDFRPEYQRLSLLQARYPGIPRMALTATADPPTRREILTQLGLEQARAFVSGFDRPNIRYAVVPKSTPREQLRRFLEASHRAHAGIVYCLSRRKVEQTAEWLRSRGFDALAYHAGLTSETRSARQQRFLDEDGVVMVATIAFGMGIDKPDVRFVAHLDLPKSIESYYQETGRAGRDGLPADAWMAYGLQDVIMLRQFVDRSEAGEARKRVEVQKLDAILGYCELSTCRRHALLGYLGEASSEACGNCDNCLAPVETWDATEAARKALSCVYRTGQRFGAGHVIDVLRGVSNERVERLNHARLSTFGIGEDLQTAQWRSVFRQLVARGLLRVDAEGYGALQLTPASRSVLRGDTEVMLRRDAAEPLARRDKSARGRSTERIPPAHVMSAFRHALWEALRAHRLEIAKAQGVPPYVIFHDTTLWEMVERCPSTLDELSQISGVGETKRTRYGAAFLSIICAHESVEEARPAP